MISIINRKKRSKSEDRLNLLNSIPLLDSLSQETKEELCNSLNLLSIKAHSFIFKEGDIIDKCQFLINGLAMLSKHSDHEKEVGLEIVSNGEPLGILAVLDNIPLPISAIAINDSVIVEFEKTTFVKCIDNNLAFERTLMCIAKNRFRNMQSLMSKMVASTAEERVAYSIQLLAKRIGKSNKSSFEIPITRRELGILAGVTTETAIRITKAFEKQKRISLKKRGIIEVLDRSLYE